MNNDHKINFPKTQINWFPGHMRKTERLMISLLPQIDIIVELLDARIPKSSHSMLIDKILQKKPHCILLNKSDMADPNLTQCWIKYYRKLGVPAFSVSSVTHAGFSSFFQYVSQLKEKQTLNKKISGRPIRMMIVGIPNIGKSTFINQISGQKHAKVENRPGVTRDKQWIHTSKGMDLLDTPGVLQPKFEDDDAGLHLAYTGAIKDDVFDLEFVAMHLLSYLLANYPDAINQKYKIQMPSETDLYDQFSLFCQKKGWILHGNEADTLRGAHMLLKDFRSGKLGKITLEAPNSL